MKVLVITTSRADWTGLGMVAQALVLRGASVAVAGCGPHLKAVMEDRFQPASWFTSGGNLASNEAALILLLDSVIEDARPDVAVVCGDRYETLVAAQLVALRGIKLAHLAGGDVSEGSLDDKWRDAISLIADMHFPFEMTSQGRLSSLLVEAGHYDPVHLVPSPALARITHSVLYSKGNVCGAVGVEADRPLVLVNYQIASAVSAEENERAIEAIFIAIANHQMPRELGRPRLSVVVCGMNPDPDFKRLSYALIAATDTLGRCRYVPNMQPHIYLSLLKHAALLIGNSSSGYYEAPAFGTPVIDVGPRQDGRGQPRNMQRVAPEVSAVDEAIGIALSATRPPPIEVDGTGHTQIADIIVGGADADRG